MAGVSVLIKGDWSRFRNRLNRLTRIDWTGLHQDLGEALLTGTMQRWKEEKDPTGKHWVGHDPDVKAKDRSKQILVETRTLQNSITYKAESDKVVVGTNVVYARIHQYGGFAGRGRKVKIPARPYLGISQDDLEEMQAIVEDTIKEALK